MPVDPSPSRVANQQLQSIPFGNLIGAPLDAAITAQAQAALSTVDFIQSVGLQKVTQPSGEEIWEAITVSFVYQDSDGLSRSLVVPLLALVPIPLIVIDDLNIDFKANISAASSTSLSTTTSSEANAEVSGSARYWFFKVNFKASYSSKKDSTATADSKYSVEYTMDVRVHAGQADMPAGLSQVLDFLQQSVATRNPTGDLIVTVATPLQMNAVGETITATIVAVNGDNKPLGAVGVNVTSSDAMVTVGTVNPTNAYGQTTAVLTCASLPSTPTIVTVTADATIGGETRTEDIRINVG